MILRLLFTQFVFVMTTSANFLTLSAQEIPQPGIPPELEFFNPDIPVGQTTHFIQVTSPTAHQVVLWVKLKGKTEIEWEYPLIASVSQPKKGNEPPIIEIKPSGMAIAGWPIPPSEDEIKKLPADLESQQPALAKRVSEFLGEEVEQVVADYQGYFGTVLVKELTKTREESERELAKFKAAMLVAHFDSEGKLEAVNSWRTRFGIGLAERDWGSIATRLKGPHTNQSLFEAMKADINAFEWLKANPSIVEQLEFAMSIVDNCQGRIRGLGK